MGVIRDFFAALIARRGALFGDAGYKFGLRSYGGVRVTPENAMQVAAVWACMDATASPLSSSHWNVMLGTRFGDTTELLPDDNLQYVLNTRFNPEMTAQSGKRAVMLAAVGMGNGYAEIETDLAKRIVGLWPLPSDRTELRRDEKQGFLFYRVWGGDGKYYDLMPNQVFHVRGAGFSGFAGDEAIGRAVKSISAAIALDEFMLAYFANNAQMGVVLETPNIGRLDDPTFQRLKAAWEERHVGVRNAFRVGFMDGGMKLHQLNIEAEKAQLIEAKHLSVEEICRWFRVPPHKVGHLLRATNNNIEHQGLEFSRETLRPWRVEIEQEADYKLIPARGQPKFIELDLDWAEQGDYKSRAEAYQILLASGVFSVNNVLSKLGENTIGPEGDVRTINSAAIRLEDVGKNLTPANDPPPEDDDDDEGDDEGDEQPDDQAFARAWLAGVYALARARYQERMRRNGHRPDAEELALANAMSFLSSHWENMAEIFERIGVLYTGVKDGMPRVLAGEEIPVVVDAVFRERA